MRVAILAAIGICLIVVMMGLSGRAPGKSGALVDNEKAFGGPTFAERIGFDPDRSGSGQSKSPGPGPYPLEQDRGKVPENTSPTANGAKDPGIWGEPARFAPPDPIN